MARLSAGAARPCSRPVATVGGTARTTVSSTPRTSLPPVNSRAVTQVSLRVTARSRLLSRRAAPFALQESERGVDQGGGEPVARDIGAHRHFALQKRRAQHRPQQGGGGLGGIGVEHRGAKRRPQAVVERPGGAQHPGNGGLGRAVVQAERRQVMGPAAARHPARGRRDPPGQAPGVGPDHPACARGEIDEGKGGAGLAVEHVVGTDVGEIFEDREVRAQHEVVAVIDQAIERRLKERTGAAARVVGGVVERDRAPGLDQRDRAGEAGDAGADDVNRAHGRARRLWGREG